MFCFLQFCITHSERVLEKYTHYLHLQHNTLKNKAFRNIPNNDISVLRRNSCNSVQKQTDVSSFALRIRFAKTFTSTIVNMKIYHMHISSVRNVTLTSCCSGVTITDSIHYCSDFEIVQSSQIFCRNAEEYCEHFCWRIGKQISFSHTK